MKIIIIAAMTRDRVIGKQGKLPWHLPEDMKIFKTLTTGNTVIMGRKTFESLGEPLPNRNNLVVSTTMDNRLDLDVCGTLQHAILKAKTYGKDIFIIGGAGVYEQALPLADKMYLSLVKESYEGDVYFPEFDEKKWEIERREDHPDFQLIVYERRKDAAAD